MKRTDHEENRLADVATWAEEQFGQCQLGDTRRTRRLVDYAARQAAQPEAMTHAVCGGDDAVVEATYRWLRNDDVNPEAVDEGPFRATAARCRNSKLVLAIQDTTTLVYQHSVAEHMGKVGGEKDHLVSGMLAHSTLMVDAHSGEPLGLIGQHRWTRPPTPTGSASKRQKSGGKHKKRAYEDKESIKWEQATKAMRERLEDASNVITVCDREADVYEYLTYLTENQCRFVVRVSHDRNLVANNGNLFSVLMRQRVVGKRSVEIEQRGAQKANGKQKARTSRPARTASMAIRVTEVKLARPADRRTGPESLKLSVVYLRESNPPRGEEPAEWLLFTTERVSTRRQFAQVVDHYEHRWLIEEFHKCWKSGCRIEQRRLQSVGNLARIMAVTSHIAVRLLTLRALSRLDPERPCTVAFSESQWRCLFARMEPERPAPKRPPTVAWAFSALAKLAGWRDTKRTGRVGWQTLWRGWAKLDSLVEGWNLARRGA